MKNTKAVIFDMDGVIIDSEKLWKQAEYEIFSSLGVKVTDEFSERTRSMTTAEVTKFWYCKFPWQDKEPEVVEQMVISRVIQLIETEECDIGGVKSFIERIKAKDYKIGLATNSPNRVIPVVLQKLDISHLFDAIVSAEFVEHGKPDPSIYFAAAKSLDTDTKNCIAIEDSYPGMLAAKNAGMTVIAFMNGNKQKEFEIADYRIDSFEYSKPDIINL